MPSYFNLSAAAWRQLRRAWELPWTTSLEVQARIAGLGQSAAGGLQTLIAGRRRAAMPMNGAVVVLGFWRSGTTLLRELLCTDDRFGFPTHL